MAEDKRIRELQLGTISLSWFLPFDGVDLVEAKKGSVEDFINIVSSNVQRQVSTSGTTNPDNEEGNDYDFYYKTDGSSFITQYQKVAGIWQIVWSLTAGGGSKIIKEGTADSSGVLDLSGEPDLPEEAVVTIYNDGLTNGIARYDEATGIIDGNNPGSAVKAIFI